jgi:hypothetical protein
LATSASIFWAYGGQYIQFGTSQLEVIDTLATGFQMTRFFNTINQYFEVEPSVSVQSLKLNGLLISALDESSNDISIASTDTHSLLLSLTGSDYHHVRIGEKVCEAPTRPGDVSLIPSGVDLHSSWRAKGDKLKTITIEFNSSLFKAFTP